MAKPRIIITQENDVNVKYDNEVLNFVWMSEWKKKIARFMIKIQSSIYPATLSSLFIIFTLVTSLFMANVEVTLGVIRWLEQFIPGESLSPITKQLAACIIFSFCLWVFSIYLLQYTLKLLLLYNVWLFEESSFKTYFWGILLKILTKRRPMLYSFQNSLPRLPLPSLKETMDRYLHSVSPLLDKENYENMKQLACEFQNGVGKKLQFLLWLKSWWSTNYVSDWWEEHAYLSQRTSLLVHNNWYGLDYLPLKTKNQVERAANIIYASLIFRNLIDTQKLKPITVQTLVPLCSWQYERTFNTTRIPGVEKDRIVHLSNSQHIAVYHKGRYYKVMIYNKKRILRPVELQWQLQQILDDSSVPARGEQHLAALTANNRTVWANARSTYFSKGINKESLKAIEDAAFFLVLSEEEFDFDPNDSSKLNKLAQASFHGKGYNIWLDKSFNIMVFKNGRCAINVEHSWSDATILGHLFEFVTAMDIIKLKNTEERDGNAVGEFKENPPPPSRLKWDLQPECLDLIKSSIATALDIIAEVDLKVLYYSDYGKRFIKSCKVSPDAFIQMVLQLAYYRDTGCFNLTYEPTTMRLFRNGRTDTVRTVTMESCKFVLSVDNPNISKKKKLAFFQRACQKHQQSYKNVMSGNGVDRHIFCLYILSKILDVKSPFLEKVISEPWKLSTSQSTCNQSGKLAPEKFPEYVCFGGGFAQVTDDGYGVFYEVTDNFLFFHVCSKRTSTATDTTRFIRHLEKSLHDVKQLCV